MIDETRSRQTQQDTSFRRGVSGIPEGGSVDHKKDNEQIGNHRAVKRTKWALIAYQEIEPETGNMLPEKWYCRDDPSPKPNLQDAYWSRTKIPGMKEVQRYLKPDGRTWASHWMDVSA